MHMDTSNAYLENSNREPKNTLPVFCDTLAKLKSDKQYLLGKGYKTQNIATKLNMTMTVLM